MAAIHIHTLLISILLTDKIPKRVEEIPSEDVPTSNESKGSQNHSKKVCHFIYVILWMWFN